MPPLTSNLIELKNLAAHIAEFLSKSHLNIRLHEAREKEDVNVGHHSVVTKADLAAQGLILQELSKANPNTFFLTEEKTEEEFKLIVPSNLHELDTQLVKIIDPLDGTSQYAAGLYEWSVSLGEFNSGVHEGGVIAAPKVLDGLMIWGQRGRGVYAEVGNKEFICTISKESKKLKDAVVLIGPDLFFLKPFSKFLHTFSEQVRTTNCVGSCALGLALVALGKIDALIQPVQCPWDWGAGYPLVEEAGYQTLFYHYRNGKLEQLSKPDIESYDPVKRNTAFMAGRSEIVEGLWAILEKTWGD